MGHLHWLDEITLTRLFDRGMPAHTEFIGNLPGYAPDWLYAAGRRLGNLWYSYNFGQCPGCGATDRPVAPNPLGFLLERLIWRLESVASPRPAWILMLFQMRGNDS
jgi:hypothetical protein